METSAQVSEKRSAPPAPFTLRKLHPAIGAEIIGLDLSQPLDPATVEAVKQAWHDNSILLFRDQKIGGEQQVRFANYFGPLAKINAPTEITQANAQFMFVSNVRENGKLIGDLPDGEMWFHSDQCHAEKPCSGSMLFAMEIPSKGGNTLFASCYAAYETLPDAVKARIAGLKAMNIYDYEVNTTRKVEQIHAVPNKNVPHHAHPVVRTHPATGRKALYVNRLMTAYIEGVSPQESDTLLGELFNHVEKKEFVYEHVWRKGDLMIWDNRCALHARTDFDPKERRMLRRVVIAGDKPF